MMAPTHFIFALALAYIFRLPRLATAIAGAIPDIDFLLVYTGWGFPFIHRGFVHSILFCLFLVLIIYIIFRSKPLAAAFGAGFLGHLATDIITPSGVMLFYPWNQYISLNLVYYDSIFANVGIVLLSVAFILICSSKWYKDKVPGLGVGVKK